MLKSQKNEKRSSIKRSNIHKFWSNFPLDNICNIIYNIRATMDFLEIYRNKFLETTDVVPLNILKRKRDNGQFGVVRLSWPITARAKGGWENLGKLKKTKVSKKNFYKEREKYEKNLSQAVHGSGIIPSYGHRVGFRSRI